MNKFLLLLLLVLSPFALFAQKKAHRGPDPKMFKEIQEYKVKFLAQEMELNDDQKARFAELYTKMSEEKRKNFENMMRLEKQLKENASEAEYKDVSDQIVDSRIRDAQIEKEYDAKFAKFLSRKQIYKMKAAEEKFRKKMREMHHKKKRKTASCDPDTEECALPSKCAS